METLSIQSNKRFALALIKELLSRHWRVDTSTNDTLVVHSEDTRAYIYPDTESKSLDLFTLFIDYSDVELAKALLQQIADDSDLIVDNDFGTILTGSDFVARCKTDPDWDWRSKS